MRYAVIFFLFVLFSCQKKNQQNLESVGKTISDQSKHYNIDIILKDDARQEILDWREYYVLKDFLSNFTNITPSKALSSSKELTLLSKTLRDSVRPFFLKTPAFKARVNVYLNEVLRLDDMSDISSIDATEVNFQVQKVLESYAMMNSKIETTVKKKQLDETVLKTNYKTSLDSLNLP